MVRYAFVFLGVAVGGCAAASAIEARIATLEASNHSSQAALADAQAALANAQAALADAQAARARAEDKAAQLQAELGKCREQCAATRWATLELRGEEALEAERGDQVAMPGRRTLFGSLPEQRLYRNVDGTSVNPTYTLQDAETTWAGAVAACAWQGQRLAQPDSDAKWVALRALGASNIWVAAVRVGSEFHWLHSGDVVPAGMNGRWNYGEPNNWRGHESCAEIRNEGLNDNNCERSFSFACEPVPEPAAVADSQAALQLSYFTWPKVGTMVYTLQDLEAALNDTQYSRIVLAAGHYHITTTLVLDRDVYLEAAPPGATLDGQHLRRVLEIRSGAHVHLSDLTIMGGSAADKVKSSSFELSWKFLSVGPR